MQDLPKDLVESIYLCGCSRFSSDTICSDHGHTVLGSGSTKATSWKKFKRKNVSILKCLRPKRILKNVPKNFDYLNIDYSDIPINLDLVNKLLRKASPDVFIQIEVEPDAVGIEKSFQKLGLTFAGESVLLSGKVDGFKQHRILYFYFRPKTIRKSKFNCSYMGSENMPDRFWLTKLDRKNAVFLNVHTDKCWPILNNFKGKLFIQTPFNSVSKSLTNPEYRKIFPRRNKVPNE